MNHPPTPSHLKAALDRLWERMCDEYLGMRYNESIGWYNVKTGKSEDRLIVKRNEPNDISAN